MDNSAGRAPNPLRAAEAMAEIVKAELGIEVRPTAILKLFAKRWQTLSNLAHEIHSASRTGQPAQPI